MSELSDLFGNPQALVSLVGQQVVDSTVSNMPLGVYSYGAFTLGTAQQIAAATGTRVLQFLLNGAGATPSTGVFAQISVPYSCTIAGWVITADQTGSAIVDILRSTYAAFPTTASIAGTDKPTLSGAQKNEDLTLTGWGSTAINAGDILQANLNSIATVTQVFVTLYITVP
jgi:hypothetical protein